MLQLVYLFATQPRKDKALFDSFISKQQAMYQNIMSDPSTVFQDTLIKAVYRNHPRAPKLPNPEDIGKIDMDRALAIYKERFSDVNGFTFIIVGSFEIDVIKPLLEIYIGSLNASDKKPSFRDIGLRPTQGVVSKKVFKGTEEKSYINISFHGEAPYSQFEKLKLQASIELLNIKIIETLREEMSSVYGAGVEGSMTKNPYNNYSINISMPCGPDNVDKLLKASFDEIQKIKEHGAVEAELNKVKETWKKQHQEHIKDNSYWARALQNAVENDVSPIDILSFEKRVDVLTPKDIQQAIDKYFDMKNRVQVVLYPEQ
jgi:zinc protease